MESKRQKMEENDELEEKVEEEVTSLREQRKEEEQSEMNETGKTKMQTFYYCKTCSGEPSLCPVPCFELYHTNLIYKTAPELEIQGGSLK